MSEWNYRDLKSLLGTKGYIRGPFGSALKRGEMKSEGVAVYEQEHAIYNRREFRYFINDDKFEELKRFEVKPNDLIISCSGTVGRISIISPNDPKGIISQALLILRPDTTLINSLFLKYFFQTRLGFYSLINASHGSVQVNIAPRSTVETIEVPCPGINEQNEIISIIDNLDQKINLLSQQNQDLEELAQIIFKQWFVEYEFPNEDDKPYFSNGGKMVESDLGDIPEGWQFLKLKDTISKLIDNRGKTPEYFEEGIPALSAKYVKHGKIINQDSHNYVSQELFNNSEKLEKGDIVMTSEAPLGELYYVAINTNYYPAQRVYTLRTNNNIIKSSILYYWLNSFHGQYLVHRRATGTTVQGIKQSELLNVEILVPDIITQRKISTTLDNILLKKEVNETKIQTLLKLRDTLLPKLMSGELRVNIN